jgi:hypothetical protein
MAEPRKFFINPWNWNFDVPPAWPNLPAREVLWDEYQCFHFKPDFGKLEAQLTADVEQIKRQQVHIDEIKRLCHVR